MAKYHELVETYSKEIAAIKAAMKEHDELVVQANAIEVILEPPFYGLAEAEELYEQAQEIFWAMDVEWSKLAQDIEAEYWDVPFARPRKQGIEGFWREAGLSPK